VRLESPHNPGQSEKEKLETLLSASGGYHGTAQLRQVRQTGLETPDGADLVLKILVPESRDHFQDAILGAAHVETVDNVENSKRFTMFHRPYGQLGGVGVE
jgi:hypothetical protein